MILTGWLVLHKNTLHRKKTESFSHSSSLILFAGHDVELAKEKKS